MSLEDSKQLILTLLNFHASLLVSLNATLEATWETVWDIGFDAKGTGLSSAGDATWYAARDVIKNVEGCVTFNKTSCVIHGVVGNAAKDAADIVANDVAGETAKDVALKEASATTCHTLYNSAYEAADYVVKATPGMSGDIIKDRASAEIEARSGVTTIKVAMEAAKNAARNVLNSGKFTIIADAACWSAITDRKKIEQSIKEKAWDKIPDIVLSSEEKMKIIHKLMTYEGEELSRLRQTIPRQLCNIFFRLEFIIRVKAKLEEEREEKALMELNALMKHLGATNYYAKLFAPSISVEMIPYLPPVLANIVVGYTELSVFDPNDVDEIFRRMLLMSK